jgi:hypothetical protein
MLPSLPVPLPPLLPPLPLLPDPPSPSGKSLRPAPHAGIVTARIIESIHGFGFEHLSIRGS